MKVSTLVWVAGAGLGLGLISSFFMTFGAQQKNTFILTSAAFRQGQALPPLYSLCKGENRSPALTWRNAPPATKSFALICDDPDAPQGTWVHWVVYNLPAKVRQLPESVDIRQLDGLSGLNSYNNMRYDGPCPPSGTHRYFFKVYALDTMLDLASGASAQELTAKMAGHILAQAEIMGTFTA